MGLFDDPDEVTLILDGTRVTNWTSIHIARSLDGFPSTFSLTAVEPYPDQPTRAIARPFRECRVFIGSDQVIQGYVDRLGMQFASGQHLVTVSGRGKCSDLVDCSAKPGQRGPTNIVDLATELAKPFGITVVNKAGTNGPQILQVMVANGETAYEAIEKLSRYAQMLIYESEKGELVLDVVGTSSMASGLVQGVNCELAAVVFDATERFSEYTAVYSTIDQFLENGGQAPIATVKDETVPRYRPRIIVSEQVAAVGENFEVGKARAEWEFAHRAGRSQAVTVSCRSWRDDAGALWAVNKLCPIKLPALKKGDASWMIGTVSFRKGADGTHADLVLMPPDAFKVMRQPLSRLFDYELTGAPGGTQGAGNPGATTGPLGDKPVPTGGAGGT